MDKYVDRCLCGYFVTQQEVDEGECPECNRNVSNLSDSWQDWENKEISEMTAAQSFQPSASQAEVPVNSPNTGGIQQH